MSSESISHEATIGVPSLGALAGPSLAELLTQACTKYSERVALIEGETGRETTYAQVAASADRWRRRLQQLGCGRASGVALLSRNRPEILPALQGILAAGCRYTPLHPLGSLEDQTFITQDAEIVALVYEPGLLHERALALKAATQIRHLIPIDADEAVPQSNVEIQGPSESDLAMLLYTGGTSGRPKGVMWPHRLLVQMTLAQLAEWPWPRDIRYLAVTPLSHGSLCLVPATLWRGGTLITLAQPTPEAIADVIERLRVTTTFMAPSLIYKLLDDPALDKADLSSIELLVYGASPISPDRLRQALERFGRVFWQLYAQTEAPMTVTGLGPADHDPERRPELLASCGRALLGSRVQLQDDQGQPVPAGSVGEICVQGPIVMDGYWKRPDETAIALRGGWLHTGDLARQDDDGYFYIVDRLKDMIITGGMNVFSREVEDVIMQHPAVASCAVIGVPDNTWGEAVKALVVKSGDVSANELIELVRAKKGPIHTPKSVDFIEEMPLTAVGKPDKKALRARYWQSESRQVH